MNSVKREDRAMPRIEVEIYGETYTGSYEIQGEMIEVSYRGRTKKTQLGGYVGHPELLARSMIRELVQEEWEQSTGG